MNIFDFPPDHGIVYAIVLYGMGILLIALIIRVIAMWARLDERYAFIRFLAKLTDPFITPFRRLIPPVGILDLSWIIAFFLLTTLQILLLQSLPTGW
jgi:YggT family protein